MSLSARDLGVSVFSGCLRNATAVAAVLGPIPAESGLWRPGNVGRRELAASAFERAAEDLPSFLRRCASGRELVERGFSLDVELASALDVSSVVARLDGEAFDAVAQ